MFYVIRNNDIIYSGTYEECEAYIENYCKIKYTHDLLTGQIYIIDSDGLSLTDDDVPY